MCRFNHNEEGWIAAKILEQGDGNACYYAYFGNEFQCQYFEIARENHANEYRWMGTHRDADTPCDKVLTQPNWGVGRIYLNDEVSVGKVSHATKSIYAPFFGKEHARGDYDVLIRNC